MLTWLLLACARLLILTVPFTFVRRLLGEDRTRQSPPPAPLTPEQRNRAKHIGRLVEAAAARAPWRADCYPQALSARTLLAVRRIPHIVSFGVRREGEALVAHAWVSAGEVTVTGGDPSAYTEVGRFVWNPQ